MKRVKLTSIKFKFVTSFDVRTLLLNEIENKIFSWGNGYHDVWVALYDAIEE
jgi:hypothetical protein